MSTEIEKLLASNGAFKSDLMQSYLSSAGQSSTSSSQSTLSTTGNLNDNINRNLSGSVLDNAGQTTTSTTTTTTPSTTTNLNLINTNVNTSDIRDKNLNLMAPKEPATTTSTTTKQAATSELADTNANSAMDVDQILKEVQEPTSESRKSLTRQVADAIADAHLATTINTYANVEEANKRIEKGDVPDMSKMSISSSAMWQQFTAAMAPEIAKVVMFVKKLPGFSDVEAADQMKLIKQGTFEVMVARFSMLIDEKAETMFDPTLKMKTPRNVISDMPMGAFIDQFFLVANQFNPLKLTDGEIGLFTAVLIMSEDRADLTNTSPISAIRKLFMQSLYFQMKENHKDAADSKFKTLMGMIPLFRKINDDHNKHLGQMKTKSPAEFSSQFPPLHQEVFVPAQ